MMTELQAHVLLAVVRHAKRFGYRIPTGKELISYLPKERQGMTARAATYHIKNLHDTHGCFPKKNPRTRFLDSSTLITEPETAYYILQVQGMCNEDPDGRVQKESIDRFFLKNEFVYQNRTTKFSRHLLDYLYTAAIKSDYLEKVEVAMDTVVAGSKLFKQLPYLKLLAEGVDVS